MRRLLLVLALVGCGNTTTLHESPELEGDDPGECADDADNDADGDFDCDDSDCAGAAVCSGCSDVDADGVCDDEDACAGGDDTEDADGDGQPDACDPCPADATDDTDGDGVCDGEDACPDADDLQDADGDGVADSCDPCPLNNPDDTDNDGVCDGSDSCPGFDDALDADGDGQPNGCDPCPIDNPDDTDSDGVCDADDACPGSDDGTDTDGDSTPDGCDPCPTDPADDSDGDGSCDSADPCPGDPTDACLAAGCSLLGSGPTTCPAAFTDSRDGRAYAAVRIGNQCWMAENLAYGTTIDSTAPGHLATDNGVAECFAAYDNDTNLATYGALYEWTELMQYSASDDGDVGTTQGLCPVGWHVPTDCEWQALEYALGVPVAQLDIFDLINRGTGITVQMQTSGSSGFDGILGTPIRHYTNGQYYNNGGILWGNSDPMSIWWTATEESATMAIVRGLSTSDDSIGRRRLQKSYGFPVRCIAD